jgi:hypothetical protein
VQSLRKKRPASGLSGCAGSWLKAKARRVAGLFFSYYFYFNGLSETKMPTSADLFLVCKGFGLFGFGFLILEFGRFEGLTRDFAGIFGGVKICGNRSWPLPSSSIT